MKRWAISTTVALAALGVTNLPAEANSVPTPTPQGVGHLVLDYDGLLIIKVLDVHIDQQIQPTTFTAGAQIRTSGVLSLFKKVDVHAASQGPIRDDSPTPASFRHENHDGQDNRKVQVRWDGADVTTDAAPYWPNMGEPAVTPAQKRASADPLTQLMRLSLTASPDGPCHGAMRMFDGRQLYEVTLKDPRARAASPVETRFGLTNPIRCALDLKEVAGFDAKPAGNRSQGLKMPLVLRLAQTVSGAAWIITGLTGQTPLGDARIELRALKMEG